MKKTATLVAGLLLVTGTVLATGLNGWDLTGTTVEGDLWLMHSVNGPLTSEGGDLNVELKAAKEGDFGKFEVTATFDKGYDEDRELTLAYSRTQGNFEVGLGATIMEETDDQVRDSEAQFRLKTNENSDSYLKWNISEKTSLTYYPWEVADMSWDNETWESFDILDQDRNNGGLALGMKVNEGTSVNLKYAIISGNDSNAENFYAFKAELSTKLAKGSVDAYAGMTQEVKAGGATTAEAMTAAGVLLNMDLSEKMALTAELNYQDQDYKEDAALGAYAKVAAKLADMAEYKPTAYASFKYLNGTAWALDDGQATAGAVEFEDYMELEAGLTLAQGNFSVTPKLNIEMQDNGFGEYDKAGTEDMSMKVGVNFKYEL